MTVSVSIKKASPLQEKDRKVCSMPGVTQGEVGQGDNECRSSPWKELYRTRVNECHNELADILACTLMIPRILQVVCMQISPSQEVSPQGACPMHQVCGWGQPNMAGQATRAMPPEDRVIRGT